MPSLWFCVPAHGRAALTRICLTQLRRTCDALEREGIAATAVVVADDQNLTTAHHLGFATVERENTYLARKFNDGIQLACDPRYNPRPADFVVPFGSDDWADHRIFFALPAPNEMVGFQRLAVVREDGLELTTRHLGYSGGSGIRIYPRELMAGLSYRPADEDLKRACDTSILTNLRLHHGDNMKVMHYHLHDYQIVDWKSPSEQMNSYDTLGVHQATASGDPFVTLADVYPAEALADMRQHYASVRERVAA
jgi:hypothetical protein